MTKSELFWKVLIFFGVYVSVLNTFAFIEGAPSIIKCEVNTADRYIDQGLTVASCMPHAFGLGKFADIPQFLTFMISFVWILFIIFLVYEMFMPTK